MKLSHDQAELKLEIGALFPGTVVWFAVMHAKRHCAAIRTVLSVLPSVVTHTGMDRKQASLQMRCSHQYYAFDKQHNSRHVHPPDHSSSWHLKTCNASAWKLVRVGSWIGNIYIYIYYVCLHVPVYPHSIVAGLPVGQGCTTWAHSSQHVMTKKACVRIDHVASH